MSGCLRVLVAAVLTLAVLAGTTGPGIADEASRRIVFSFTDDRITESSGLVDAGSLMFTVNDSGDDPVVYAVDRTTGDTVGVTTYSSDDVSDVEAIAPGPEVSMPNGTVWVGDIGDNDMDRASVDLYAVPRPGRGNRDVEAARFHLVYPDGSQDAETLLVHPQTGRVYIVSKAILGGIVYAAPSSLEPESVNALSAIGHVPDVVTDGAFFPDGEHVLLRSYGNARVYTFPGLREVGKVELPTQEQGEAVSIGPTGRIHISTEGELSDVIRVQLPAGLRASVGGRRDTGPNDGLTGDEATGESSTSTTTQTSTNGVWVAAGVVALVAVGWLLFTVSRRRSRRSS